MRDEVLTRAAAIEEEYGPDIDEALNRWQDEGGPKQPLAHPWLSVAFLFGRKLRLIR